ncbi:DUF4262 domain-containing protein [Actinomadura rugatobispora]|uniref:DUF4262 domain-containing protein n=1 Tax=Actinomadura rugatobispora TaxID=1994 RepID=A0ABW1A5Q0_9ACTN
MSRDQPPCRCLLCHDYGDEIEPMTAQTIAQIHEHGWQVMMIPTDDVGPGWAFTIGLWHTHGIPELAMFGLDIYDMKDGLNGLAERALKGRPVKAGQLRHEVIDNHPVMLKAVDLRWYRTFFGSAIMFYRRPPFPLLQVVWPDHDGFFPWQPESDVPYRRLQPQLWLTPTAHPKGVWTQDL